MIAFEDIQDIEEWLAPLDYCGFWQAVGPWAVFDDSDRDHCDDIITKGVSPPETVLFCLKAMARVELTARFGLKDRIHEPPDRQYLMTTH